MGWISAAASGLAAAVGVGVIAVGLNLSAAAGEPDVWIDGPLAEARLEPGPITVSAHATADDEIEALVLSVDGKDVATATDLKRTGKLVYATFEWDAAAGQHVLVVTQEGGAATRSAQRLVYVGTPVDPGPVEPTPTPSEKPSEKPSPSETPSETPSATVTPSESATPKPEPRPEPKPTRSSEPTPTPDPPVIDATGISYDNPYGSALVYRCTVPSYTATITARVRGATKVEAVIDGFGVRAMSNSSSSWSVTIPSSPTLPSSSAAVQIRATGPGGQVSRSAGTLSIVPNCPKD